MSSTVKISPSHIDQASNILRILILLPGPVINEIDSCVDANVFGGRHCLVDRSVDGTQHSDAGLFNTGLDLHC